jgi:predicted small metal-binding protein
MPMSIGCRELGMDCGFTMEGETRWHPKRISTS